MDSSAPTAIAAAQTAFRIAGTAIALLDAQGTVVGWTQAAQRLVGYSAADVVGRSGAAFLTAGDDRAKASAFAEPQCPLSLVRLDGGPSPRRPQDRRTPVRAAVVRSGRPGPVGRGGDRQGHAPLVGGGRIGHGVADGGAASAEQPAGRCRGARHRAALHLGQRHPGPHGRHPS
ncbi:PAS domain-containing protein [Streptomyces sp. NPDC059909]|uniref:PAS domain-containing protein n=1 Tax=Streptomyces sp. NPDC059909 TaxID=3346998 RepID=UPI0036613CAF